MSYRFDQNYRMMFPPLTPVIKGLIIANSAVFLIQIVSAGLFKTFFIELFFGLTPQLVTEKFFVWQFLTAMFLHGGFLHLLFNMLGLFFFGADLEWLWGKKRLLSFYFLVGIAANLFSYLLDIHSKTLTIGASGAVLGFVGAYAAIYPNRYVTVFIFPMKMKYFVICFYLIPTVLSLAGVMHQDEVAHAVHLAGLILGIAYVKLNLRSIENLKYAVKEKIRLWRIKRKYRNFRVVDSDVKQMWDDLEERINKDSHNSKIN
ncbi:MAG: rhomboid family intramembrane serine protease [Blastocatellia bacterium]|nr:rhomboid family intramembrane serine protease [Blastocatellia bacterium]